MSKVIGEYQPFNYPHSSGQEGYTIIQGVRQQINSNNVYIVGTYIEKGTQYGALYNGPLSNNGLTGSWELFSFGELRSHDDIAKPRWALDTSFYGVNNVSGLAGLGLESKVEIVGSYVRKDGRTVGLLLVHGKMNSWVDIDPTEGKANKTFVHSVMGNLAVGNYDLGIKVYSFIYNKSTQAYVPFLVESSSQTTLYGIWCNSERSYTICGGCVMDGTPCAFIADINSDGREEKTLIIKEFSHAQGITSNHLGGYNLALNELNGLCAMASINRDCHGELDTAINEITRMDKYPIPIVSSMSANTIIDKNILGIYEVNVGSRTVPVSYLYQS